MPHVTHYIYKGCFHQGPSSTCFEAYYSGTYIPEPENDKQREAIALLDAAANEDGALISGVGELVFDTLSRMPYYYLDEAWS